MRLQKLAVQINDGLQGAFFRRAQFKDRADGLWPGTQTHLRKIRMNDVHKFSRSDDAHARGGASSGQQSWRDDRAVTGQRERVDQGFQNRQFGYGSPQRGDGIEIDEVTRAARAEAGLHGQPVAVAQQIRAAGHALVDGVLLSNLLAQRGAFFVHHRDQLRKRAVGHDALDFVKRKTLPLEAFDDAQPLHVRDGETPKAAGSGSIRREQPLFLIIAKSFGREAISDGKRADGYFHENAPAKENNLVLSYPFYRKRAEKAIPRRGTERRRFRMLHAV